VQVHIHDPAFTDSERSRAKFQLAAKLSLGFQLVAVREVVSGSTDVGFDIVCPSIPA
jgi:hypothetical protein